MRNHIKNPPRFGVRLFEGARDRRDQGCGTQTISRILTTEFETSRQPTAGAYSSDNYPNQVICGPRLALQYIYPPEAERVTLHGTRDGVDIALS